MDAPTSSQKREPAFRSPERFFSGFDARTTAKLIEYAADVTLVIENGVIEDVAISDASLQKEGYQDSWRGKSWISTVTPDSRTKIEDLLASPTSESNGRARQVNHMSSSALDVPIIYKTVTTGPGSRIVALGRDQRNVSALQQRLLRAHQDLERDYSRLREAEARYKILFETVSEAVLIVNAHSLEIEIGNQAAARLLGMSRSELIGTRMALIFDGPAERIVERLAAQALSAGSASVDGMRTQSGKSCSASASAFGQGLEMRLVVRLAVKGQDGSDAAEKANSSLLSALEYLPDALVVTGAELRILAANQAFMDMVNLSGTGQATGANLSAFLGRSATDLNVLMSSLKTSGTVRNFATIITDRLGSEDPVEVSAVISQSGRKDIYGFSIRNVARRLPVNPSIGQQLPSTADQLTNLVGRVPLKDIVRDSTVLIERLCIEAALSLTGDNRASAAEILGLSRQGLYSKLKRFGIDDKS